MLRIFLVSFIFTFLYANRCDSKVIADLKPFPSAKLISTNYFIDELENKGCNPVKENAINVHIISHTHLDAGWVKTYDEYYDQSVKLILDTVIESLTKIKSDQNRKFSFVEIVYFSRYWNSISPEQKDILRKLVLDKKLHFISGGWVMNDEATPHYSMIIDQMTLGHQWINRTFGPNFLPKIGWQIDPFGHSREYASILSQMGFNGLYLGRIDFQDKTKRQLEKKMEFIWKTDSNLKSNNYLFTGITPTGYYPVDGYCFDVWCSNMEFDESNKLALGQKFLDSLKAQSKDYATNHLMATMGGDFHYQSAEKNFRNSDYLIRTVNSMQNEFHFLYSTPDCYLESVHNSNKSWTDMKTDDFFPYADFPNDYWTGYFTSRPTFKQYVNYAHSILQVSKQLMVIADIYSSSSKWIQPIQETVAITQHHDSITGTSKQHVVDDYRRMLDNGIFKTQTVISNAYQKLLNTTLSPQFCHEFNLSKCVYTENISGDLLEIAVYNPLSRQLTHYLNLPVIRLDLEIIDSNGKPIDSEFKPIPETVQSLAERKSSAKYELCFEANLPPLSFGKYYMRKVAISRTPNNDVLPDNSKDTVISNNKLSVTIDKTSGLLKSIAIDGQSVPINQNFYYYSSVGVKASGAYSMHTNSATATLISAKASVSVFRGKLVEEVIQKFNPWLSQVIRLYRNKDYVEFDWIVGPLPTQQDIEVITRFDTNLKTDKTFFTDTNGRQTIERKRDFRETWVLDTKEKVSSNYYPITSWLFIKDILNDLQLTVLPDRTQGGSSLKDGSIELMVHRRLSRDDGYGMEEALNEFGFDGNGLVVRGKHILLLSKIEDSMKKVKQLSKQLYWKPLPMFTPVLKTSIEKSLNSISKEIDESIHILSLEELNQNNVLLRLEYFLEVNETKSKSVSISLKGLFTNFEIIDAIETSLTGIEAIAEAGKRKFKWNCIQCNDTIETNKDNFNITLYPNQIQTFLLRIKRNAK